MARLKRLPNGYLPRVKEAKAHLEKALHNLNKSTLFETSLEALVTNYHTSNRYQDTNGDLHLAFDFGIISSEFIFYRETRKWGLWNTCTVFVDNSEDFIDNYKW